jgi:arsenate reductase (thioredoxin)
MRTVRVLFVCIGNAIRSQMAEAFARTYGSDVIVARSAGVAPATAVAPLTRKILEERNIDMADQFPKGLREVDVASFDLVINMSGETLPFACSSRDWKVRDPVGLKEAVYQEVAVQIETQVIQLILELRGLQTHWKQEFDLGGRR